MSVTTDSATSMADRVVSVPVSRLQGPTRRIYWDTYQPIAVAGEAF